MHHEEKTMMKKTVIAGATALVWGAVAAPAMAADYKGPDLKGEVVTITCPWTGAEEGMFLSLIHI